MTDRKKSGASKAEKSDTHASIREIVESINIQDARRFKGPVYESLLRELYAAGCKKSAHHFKCMVVKEDNLKSTNSVRERLSDRRELLYALVDNVKLAEQSAALDTCGGRLTAFQLLYQSVLRIEDYGVLFEWLLDEIYTIVWKISFKYAGKGQHALNEVITRFYYKYGTHIDKRGTGGYIALQVLRMALDNSRGQLWQPDTYPEKDRYDTLHEAAATHLASVYTRLAKGLTKSEPKEALRISRKALFVLLQVGMDKNKNLVMEAFLDNIDHLINLKQYALALKQIESVNDQLACEDSEVYNKLKCHLFQQWGDCYFSLNDEPLVMENYQKAYLLSIKHKFRDLEGKILLQMGQFFTVWRKSRTQTRTAIEAAQTIFAELGDFQNKKKTDYLLAQVTALQILPTLYTLCKSDDYCHRHTLLQWKTQCKPFWHIKEQDPETVPDVAEIVFNIGGKSHVSEAMGEDADSHHEGDGEDREGSWDLKSGIESSSSLNVLEILPHAKETEKNLKCLLNEFIEDDQARWDAEKNAYMLLMADQN